MQHQGWWQMKRARKSMTFKLIEGVEKPKQLSHQQFSKKQIALIKLGNHISQT